MAKGPSETSRPSSREGHRSRETSRERERLSSDANRNSYLFTQLDSHREQTGRNGGDLGGNGENRYLFDQYCDLSSNNRTPGNNETKNPFPELSFPRPDIPEFPFPRPNNPIRVGPGGLIMPDVAVAMRNTDNVLQPIIEHNRALTEWNTENSAGQDVNNSANSETAAERFQRFFRETLNLLGLSPSDISQSSSQQENLESPLVKALRQQIETEQKELTANYNTLVTIQESLIYVTEVQESLISVTDAVDETVKSNMFEQSWAEYLLWQTKHPDVPLPNLGTIYGEINLAAKTARDYKKNLTDLQDLRQQINSAKDALYSITVPTAEHFATLRSEIENLGDDPAQGQLLRKISLVQEYANDPLNNQLREEMTKHAKLLLEQIEPLIEKADEIWSKAENEYNDLKKKSEGNPFFQKDDMRPPDRVPTLAFPETRERSGASKMNVIRVLLGMQGIDVSNEKRFAAKLGLHPVGDEIDLKNLHTILPTEFKDREGFLFHKIENPKDFDIVKYFNIALDHGPMGVLLDNTQLKEVPEEHHLERAVIVHHPEVDKKDPQLVILDEAEAEPYKVSVEKFSRVWNGSFILSRDTYNALRDAVEESIAKSEI